MNAGDSVQVWATRRKNHTCRNLHGVLHVRARAPIIGRVHQHTPPASQDEKTRRRRIGARRYDARRRVREHGGWSLIWITRAREAWGIVEAGIG